MKNENEENQRQLYRCFSQLLDYPTPALAEQIRQCIEALQIHYAHAAEPMAKFLTFVESTPDGRLEEVYTETFDINPACHIFAGHILFGESFKRGSFMARLEEEYQTHHFDKGAELSDHIPVMLNFLSTLDLNSTNADDLIRDCLVPVFQKMNANFKDDSANPYLPVLRGVLVVLEGAIPEESLKQERTQQERPQKVVRIEPI
jgi:nitrate reductase molybdenum cofactor assembly chaperone NarJ/NarW